MKGRGTRPVFFVNRDLDAFKFSYTVRSCESTCATHRLFTVLAAMLESR